MSNRIQIMRNAVVWLLFLALVLFWVRASETREIGISEAKGEETANHKGLPSKNSSSFPFGIGEKLVYEISWFGITAGKSELTVKEKTFYQSRVVYRLVSQTTGGGAMGKLYPVDDRLESFIDARGLFPYYALLRQREGKRKKDKDVYFDQENQQITYVTNGGRPRVLSAPPQVLDILSSLYYFRTQDLKVGKSIPLRVFSLKHNFEVAVKVLSKEIMEVLSVKREVFLVKPHITMNGAPSPYRKGEVLLWLTADEKKLPVKIRAQVRLGHIEAVLIAYEGHED